jgi:hypothetical protein
MDEVARLIEEFGSRGKRNHSIWKLDVLMDLGDINDPAVVQFLVTVVMDPQEPSDVRTDALRRLRERSLGPNDRALVAGAGLHAITSASESQLRLHAALILGDFADVEGVLGMLGSLAMDPREPIELRYNAFTSLQRAGPTTACLDILRSLSADELLGQSARALLCTWSVG